MFKKPEAKHSAFFFSMSNNNKNYELTANREYSLTCVYCEKPIPAKPKNWDTAKPFLDGNFLHDPPPEGEVVTWGKLRPRHNKRCV